MDYHDLASQTPERTENPERYLASVGDENPLEHTTTQTESVQEPDADAFAASIDIPEVTLLILHHALFNEFLGIFSG